MMSLLTLKHCEATACQLLMFAVGSLKLKLKAQVKVNFGAEVWNAVFVPHHSCQ